MTRVSKPASAAVPRRAGLAAAAALALTLLAPGVYAQAKPEPYRIGALLSVTGGLASVGLPEREGVLLAQKAINAGGGINGRPLEVIIEDDASSPDSAVAKANALIHTQKVRAIIGPSGIAQTVAIGGITQAAKVPLFAFSGLGPAVERERTCVLHMTPSQELNARAVLSYARDKGFKRAGVLHDSGYGQVVWNSMKTLDAEYGVQFLQVEKFDIAATDVTTQAAKVKAINPDVVFVIGTSAAPYRNLRQVKVAVPIVSAHPSATYETVKAMGESADNIIHPEFLVSEDPLPNQKDFVDAFRKEYGKLPKHFSAAGWDAVMVLASALKAAGQDTSGEKLCAASRTAHQGVMTRYDFAAPDMGGLTLSGYTYSKLVGGRFTRIDYRAAK